MVFLWSPPDGHASGDMHTTRHTRTCARMCINHAVDSVVVDLFTFLGYRGCGISQAININVT